MPTPEDLARSVTQYVDDARNFQHQGEHNAAVRMYMRAAEQALAIAVLMTVGDQQSRDIIEKARAMVSDQRSALLKRMDIDH